LLVSSLSDNKVLNRVQRIIDLAHEIGHSFGATHDNEDFEDNPECNPDDHNGGPFIMSTVHSDITYQVHDLMNKQMFSNCVGFYFYFPLHIDLYRNYFLKQNFVFINPKSLLLCNGISNQ
jgi:hypothetical protein